MRILWITHDTHSAYFPYVKGKPTKGGSWIEPLFNRLVDIENIKMGIISPVVDGTFSHKEISGVSYYSIPINNGENKKRMTQKVVNNYVKAIDIFKPDIIHVHGTENNFGLITEYVDKKIPVVCSIQGIIYAYLPYLRLSISSIKIKNFKSLKNLLGRGGVQAFIKKWEKYIPIEKRIIKKNQYFIGRTLWDEAQLLEVNPDIKYFTGEELLRGVFYTEKWDINKCNEHQIFVSSAAYPIKGFHTVLKAIAIVKQKYPNVKVISPLASLNVKSSKFWDFFFAEDYRRYIKSEILKYDLSDNIQLLDRISATEMADCYKNSRVFVLPSFIENSPNSLGEAMMIGTPTIVTPVGGVMSIVTNEVDTLMFPSGDHATLAYQIERLFSDDELAKRISKSAKILAEKRHNIDATTSQYTSIYTSVLSINKENF